MTISVQDVDSVKDSLVLPQILSRFRINKEKEKGELLVMGDSLPVPLLAGGVPLFAEVYAQASP